MPTQAELRQRQPYPLTRDEQQLLFGLLPKRLADMALFKVNTGCREQEVCGLRWRWEQPVPGLDMTVFVVPSELVKNGRPRLIRSDRADRSCLRPAEIMTCRWRVAAEGQLQTDCSRCRRRNELALFR